MMRSSSIFLPTSSPHPGGAERRAAVADAAFVLAVAALVRFYRLGDKSFWTDEAYTAWAAQLPWIRLVGAPFDTHSSLYYGIVKLAVAVAPVTEWVIRLPSAILGCLAAVLVHALLVQAGRRVALAGGLLFALHPIAVHFSQDARPYSLLMAVLLGVAWALARWSTARTEAAKWTAIAIYSFAATIAVYAHIVAAIWLMPFTLTSMMIAWRDRVRERWIQWLVAHAAIACLTAPALWTAAALAADSETFTWLRQPHWRAGVATWLATAVPVSLPAPLEFHRGRSILGALLFLSAVLGAIRFALVGQRLLAVVALSLCFGPLLIWLVGFAKPVFMPRTILPVVAGVCLGWAGLLAVARGSVATERGGDDSRTSSRRTNKSALLGLAVVAGLLVSGTVTQYRLPSAEDYRALALAIKAEESDRVVLGSGRTHFHAVDHYLKAERYIVFVGSSRRFWVDTTATNLYAWRTMPVLERARLTDDELRQRLAIEGIPKGPPFHIGGDVWFIVRGNHEPMADWHLVNFLVLHEESAPVVLDVTRFSGLSLVRLRPTRRPVTHWR